MERFGGIRVVKAALGAVLVAGGGRSYPDTTHGSAIGLPIRKGWCQVGQWGGIYGSPMGRDWDRYSTPDPT